MGSSRLHAVESLLVQALRHMLKAEAWPLSRDAPVWRAAPPETMDGQAPLPLSETFQTTLDDLLGNDP